MKPHQKHLSLSLNIGRIVDAAFEVLRVEEFHGIVYEDTPDS